MPSSVWKAVKNKKTGECELKRKHHVKKKTKIKIRKHDANLFKVSEGVQESRKVYQLYLASLDRARDAENTKEIKYQTEMVKISEEVFNKRTEAAAKKGVSVGTQVEEEEAELIMDPIPDSIDEDFAQHMAQLDDIITTGVREQGVASDVAKLIVDNVAIGRGFESRGAGLTTSQIEKMLKQFPNFLGVFPADQLPNTDRKKYGFILNLDPADKPGSHWVAVYVDKIHEKEIDYYDSFGKDPSTRTLIHFKEVGKSVPFMLKLKINSVVNQHKKSDSCGWLAAMFLMKRFKGISFKDATGFVEPDDNLSDDFESQVSNLKNKFQYL